MDQAVAHWKKALQINPRHGEALYNLSRALRESAPLEAQEYGRRLADLKQASMVTDEAGTLSNFALASAGAHDYQQAVAYFVTVCANNRICLFSIIVDGNLALPSCGQIVEEEWQRTGMPALTRGLTTMLLKV